MAKKKKTFTQEDDALLAELGVETKVEKAATYTAREERIIAGFEEIQRFVEEHGRVPIHGEDRDIFERLYSVRLDRIMASEECLSLLRPMDTDGLLDEDRRTQVADLKSASDEELLEALGVDAEANATADVTDLQHVRSRTEIKAVEEIAQRTACEDFEEFKPIFEKVQQELKAGLRETVKHQDDFEPEREDLFIVEGQKVLIAEMGKEFSTDYGRKDRRLRVIYDNGTESDLLLRSLQRALNRDKTSRRILPPDNEGMPLFAKEINAEDARAGQIYVLRSNSAHPFIRENRKLIHKIGVTGQEIKKRIANAKKDPTFLLADVELVESYKLANINRSKLEKLLHQFFAEVRIDLDLQDRFSESVEPREWFLAPLPMIRKAIDMLVSGEIEHCRYDREAAQIVDSRTGKPVNP